MTKPRISQICLEETPYYHCVSRCVRRAFLCGEDKFTGQSYEHRRAWIVDRLKQLSGVFAIDICAYAVMHNHTHTVLRVDKQQALSWSNEEVIDRWTHLYSPTPLVAHYMAGIKMTAAERDVVSDDIEKWRHRLYDISWFMRNLNEAIARQANQEDGCTGRFWEGRFKSQALLDEGALLTCMSYVDLNPIRAGIATMPETSDYTSIQARIQHLHRLQSTKTGEEAFMTPPTPRGLLPFIGGERDNQEKGLPFSTADYLQLTDWTGRAIRDDKSGAIPSHLAPILERLNINTDAWLDTIRDYGKRYYRVVGTKEAIRQYSQALGIKWLCGTHTSQQLYDYEPS
ncbi:MAG: transposase [Candidatus Thiodiazotropha sp. (ex Lucinoma kastoroae)]|nr:transposase [Candidatus Thiodiazotropha sp. (ex Lucinoma kastoroae)]MCU7861943.1 transposase [Candidatus Thiodiazotropha sp. (ex Lucinoma kastoroae)]